MEENKVEHVPKYFEVWPYPPSKHNPQVKVSEQDHLVQYRYNKQYWEQDRLKGDWSHLPDLFADVAPSEPLVKEEVK